MSISGKFFLQVKVANEQTGDNNYVSFIKSPRLWFGGPQWLGVGDGGV